MKRLYLHPLKIGKKTEWHIIRRKTQQTKPKSVGVCARGCGGWARACACARAGVCAEAQALKIALRRVFSCQEDISSKDGLDQH